MNKSDKIYTKLSKKYSDKEIVENFVFNETLDPKEQKKVNEEFRKLRLERLKNMSPAEILVSDLMKMKLLIKEYFKKERFDPAYSFANQLRHYISITNRNNKEIADNLSIHTTKLSRILNNKENPNIELMYRLEEHSNGEIPAYYWWRLYARQLEHLIKTDLEKQLTEAAKVKDSLNLSA